MACLYSLVIVMVLLLISYESYKSTALILKASNFLGNPTWTTPDSIIWNQSNFKLSITYDTKLPVQLYFTWDDKIVRPRNELYQILSRVCTNSINYDVGSSKFTIKDVSLENAFTIMHNILDTY